MFEYNLLKAEGFQRFTKICISQPSYHTLRQGSNTGDLQENIKLEDIDLKTVCMILYKHAHLTSDCMLLQVLFRVSLSTTASVIVVHLINK